MNTYGRKPKEIAVIPVQCTEMMFYQYMPVKLAGTMDVIIEERHKCFDELIRKCVHDFAQQWSRDAFREHYIYLTAKCLYVTPGSNMNRPGYHTDGFLSDDINYIWSDCLPTVFNRGPFEVDLDHAKSLQQFTEQSQVMGEFSYAPNTLLRLDQYSVHRTAEVLRTQVRTFFKLSFSKDKYNLRGNTHNHLLDYQWDMVDRKAERNHPAA